MSNNKLPPYQQSCLVYAARYVHTRNTGGAFQVVSTIMWQWDHLDDSIKMQLKKEAKTEATCNMEDWNVLINREV